MIHEHSFVAVTSDQVACEMQGELLILQTASGIYYGLDPIGKRVWDQLSEPKPVGSIRDALLVEYEVDRGTCTRDLVALLEDLIRKRLVEVRPAPVA
jgi:hypothetical protein